MDLAAEVPEKTTNMLQATQEKHRARWEEFMSNPSNFVRHDKTSVLTISFDEKHDDLHVAPEVDRLGEVFTKTYGFKVTNVRLNPAKAMKQAQMDVSKFVYDEDDERSLLIIYYAGHGYAGEGTSPGDMMLAGKSPSPPGMSPETNEAKESIVWSKVENAIFSADADVLLIFDCCMAGRLCRPFTRSASTKSNFQFLGACADDQVTKAPGEESFTSALIWALEDLAKDPQPFSTTKLRNHIMKAEHFPPEQIPVLADRDSRDTLGPIVIGRQGLTANDVRRAPTRFEKDAIKNRAYLDLRFVFDTELDDDRLDRTAKALKEFRDHGAGKDLDLSRIAFQGKYTAVEQAILRFMEVKNSKRAMSVVSSEETESTTAPQHTASIQERLLVPLQYQRDRQTQLDSSNRTSMMNSTASTEVGDADMGPEVGVPAPVEEFSVWVHFKAIIRRLRLSASKVFQRKSKPAQQRLSTSRIKDSP